MKKLIVAAVSLTVVVLMAISSVGTVKNFINEGWEDPGTRFESMARSYYLNVKTDGEGSVSNSEHLYEDGATVTLEAKAKDGNFFSGWYRADGSYITSSPVYTFIIGADTDLVARFFEKHEEINGTVKEISNVKNVSDSFKFDISCDKENAVEYLENNLIIVDSQFLNTEKEEEAKVEFKVEASDTGSDVYTISPVDNGAYEKGITYTAKIKEETPPEPETPEVPEKPEAPAEPEAEDRFGFNRVSRTLDAEITLNKRDEIEFTVEKDETDIQEFNDGIVYLVRGDVDRIVDDGLVSTDKGDREDYMLLSDTSSLRTGTVFCVYNGENGADGNPMLDDDCFFGKVETVSGNKVVYGVPALTEVYSKLEIFYSKETSVDGAVISDSTVEAVRKAVLDDEGFNSFAQNAQYAVKNLLGDEYAVEFVAKEKYGDALEIDVSPVISGNKVKVKINASLNMPVKDKHSNEFNVSVSMSVDKTITLSNHVDIRTRSVTWMDGDISYFDFSVGVVDEENAVINLLVDDNAPDAISSALVDEKFAREFNRLSGGGKGKDLERGGAYEGISSKVELFSVEYTEGSVKTEVSVDFSLNLDIGGTALLVSNTKNEVEVGVRADGAYNARPYANAYSQSKVTDCTVVGRDTVTTSLGVSAKFTLIGFTKHVCTVIDFDEGIRYRANGLVNTNTSHFAGKVAVDAVYTVPMLDYKVFEKRGNWSMKPTYKEHSSYGTGKAILSYVNNADLVAGKGVISFVDSSVDLFENNVLAVNIFDTDSFEIVKGYLDVNCKDYGIDVKTGSNLHYNKGVLTVKKNAPSYFESEITVKVKPKKGSNSVYHKDAYTLDLPEVTLKVIYGDEDEYYKYMDTEIQRQLRLLYRSYNKKNGGILKSNFTHLAENFITLPEGYNGLIDVITSVYVDNLFDTVTEYRKADDSKRTMENKFVLEEAEAFEYLMGFVNSIMDNKSADSGQIAQMVEYIALSRAMHDTVIDVSNSEYADVFSTIYHSASKETRDVVSEAIDTFADASKEQGVSKVAMAFKRMFR